MSFSLQPHRSPSGYSVHGILKTGILEWVTMTSSRVSSQPSDSLPLVPPGKTEPNQMEQKVNSPLTSSTPYNISSSQSGYPLKCLRIIFWKLHFIFSKMIWILFFFLFHPNLFETTTSVRFSSQPSAGKELEIQAWRNPTPGLMVIRQHSVF